jgi:hypothetical protein
MKTLLVTPARKSLSRVVRALVLLLPFLSIAFIDVASAQPTCPAAVIPHIVNQVALLKKLIPPLRGPNQAQ